MHIVGLGCNFGQKKGSCLCSFWSYYNPLDGDATFPSGLISRFFCWAAPSKTNSFGNGGGGHYRRAGMQAFWGGLEVSLGELPGCGD